MKIGIITFSSAHNYGAVLQVWALQEYLQQQGNEVEVINYRPAAVDSLYALYKPKNWYKISFLNNLVSKAQYLKQKILKPAKVKKYKVFEHFIAHDLHTTKPYYTLKELRQADFDYDLMVAGSDQIWNGKLSGGIDPAYFLAFGAPRTKRITYAASLGHDFLNSEDILFFEHYPKYLDYISVREQKAKDCIENYTDQPIDVVLDPTLLLERKSFDKIKEVPKTKGQYIYVHNVHLIRVDKCLNRVAEEVSKRLGLPIIHNRDDYHYTNEMQKFSSGSPAEFIGMISNAAYVITNSFHATVFALIYHRNFITIPHFQNPYRMQYLLEVLDLSNHLVKDSQFLPNDMKELEIEYDKVEQLKSEWKKGSIEYLKWALKGEKTVKDPMVW